MCSSDLSVRSTLPDGPVLSVETTTEEAPKPASALVTDHFHIGSTCDGPEIREIITAVAPKELYFFGPYAKRYVDELQGACPVIKPLFANDQPTLF